MNVDKTGCNQLTTECINSIYEASAEIAGVESIGDWHLVAIYVRMQTHCNDLVIAVFKHQLLIHMFSCILQNFSSFP